MHEPIETPVLELVRFTFKVRWLVLAHSSAQLCGKGHNEDYKPSVMLHGTGPSDIRVVLDVQYPTVVDTIAAALTPLALTACASSASTQEMSGLQRTRICDRNAC
ncbi:hypothetical protein NM688_g775 [Phlebia brevispora]|uniref:Uncharacterized protein n=1 Tax=Phlebia brevispora TaxID=194682 RepID=A0ACC1TDE0_9APHY|nr:hypothetical protein NM688_g775 [Phlebia brevispora]